MNYGRYVVEPTGDNNVDPEEVVVLHEKADDGKEIQDEIRNVPNVTENSTESTSSSSVLPISTEKTAHTILNVIDTTSLDEMWHKLVSFQTK